MASKKVIVYGGRGALGSVCVSHFKSANWWVGNIDFAQNKKADVNIIVSKDATCVQQEQYVLNELDGILDQKVKGVICVAGGWIGDKIDGKHASISQQVDLMWRQSVSTSCIAATIACKYLAPGGLLCLTGAQAALEGTPRMIGYGMAKAAVHHLTKSVGASDLPKNSLAVAILPRTLDTDMNRRWMPNADFSKWTPLSFVAQLLMKWVEGDGRPPFNGSLVTLNTENNITKLIIEDQIDHGVPYELKI